LKVRAKNTDELGKFFREKLKPIPEIISTKTTIVLQTIKETTALPLEDLSEDAGEAKTKRKSAKND
jgi:Lrp/AsnC family leucine-responsive transcriptional regulator